MRFSNGFFGENEATLGTLRFSAMRREVFEENADGTSSEVVKERTYDLKSDKQGRMIQVSVPASVPVRDFAYNAEVKLVNPMFGAIAHVTFGNSAEVDWYIKADDLVLKTPAQNSQPHKDVPADTFPVRTATEFVAAIPVPASPSGGQSGMPAERFPLLSNSFAPSADNVPAASPATKTFGRISRSFHGYPFGATSASNLSIIV